MSIRRILSSVRYANSETIFYCLFLFFQKGSMEIKSILSLTNFQDELTAVNVKQGFSHIPQITDEFGSAKNANISAAKVD